MGLKSVSDTAVEGRFTCKIPGDSDSPRGLLILHSSECVIYNMRESSKTKSMDITLPLFTTAFCFVILLKPVTSVKLMLHMR